MMIRNLDQEMLNNAPVNNMDSERAVVSVNSYGPIIFTVSSNGVGMSQLHAYDIR